MSFDPTKPFGLRSGHRPVTDFQVLSAPLNDGHVFAGVVGGDLLTWRPDGRFLRTGEQCSLDLVNQEADADQLESQAVKRIVDEFSIRRIATLPPGLHASLAGTGEAS